jgi:arabinan endo-1,5-alpha-L-arabinosidase
MGRRAGGSQPRRLPASVAFVLWALGCGRGVTEGAPPEADDASGATASSGGADGSHDGAAGGEAGEAAYSLDGPSVDATVPSDGPLVDAAGGTGDAGRDASPSSDGGAACGAASLGGGPLTTTTMHLDIGVHDPSMIWDGARYYLFATGGTLDVRSSADILAWASAGSVFGTVPAWITSTLGSNPGSLWAPDVSYFSGEFHLYYAGSTFGSNDSVIGLATTTSLASPRWVDQGLIVQSASTDGFNAIDPNVSFDASCTPWLAFGSFWSGIKMRKLDAATGKPATDDATLYSLASRNGGAIEAASIISHNGYYYLFVSFDQCCKGVNSTYRTMMGRATSITGPYADKAGTDMMQGAAEELLATSGRYIGPGGGTAWKDGTNYLYVYHYYDGDANGASKLQIRPINFDSSDWVTLGEPLFP